MKVAKTRLLSAFLAILIAQSGLALDVAIQELCVDILVFDATMTLATMGSAGGKYAAQDRYPEYKPYPYDKDVGQPIKDYVNGIDRLAEEAALSSIMPKQFLSSYDIRLARNATNGLLQSPNPGTWGPDILWKLTKDTATVKIIGGASKEEVGQAAAQASWSRVLSIYEQIDITLRKKFRGRSFGDNIDINRFKEEIRQFIVGLKESTQTEQFKKGIPEAKEFYLCSINKLEQKFKALGY